MDAPAAGESPPPAAEESNGEESRWLAALSDSELDFLISLKMLAVKWDETAGRPHLAGAFDLRMLRALGVVLLESFRELLKETSVHSTVLDRLALSRDPDADANVSISSSDSMVFRQRSKDQPKPNSMKKKRKQIQDGCHEEAVQSNKKRKLRESRRGHRASRL